MNKIKTNFNNYISNNRVWSNIIYKRCIIINYALYLFIGLIIYTSFHSLTSYDNSLLIIALLALLLPKIELTSNNSYRGLNSIIGITLINVCEL